MCLFTLFRNMLSSIHYNYKDVFILCSWSIGALVFKTVSLNCFCTTGYINRHQWTSGAWDGLVTILWPMSSWNTTIFSSYMFKENKPYIKDIIVQFWMNYQEVVVVHCYMNMYLVFKRLWLVLEYYRWGTIEKTSR